MNPSRRFAQTPGGRALVALIAAFVLVHAGASLWPGLERQLVAQFGLIPLRLQAELADPSPLGSAGAAATLATYAFLHGGWIHLVFNCLALAGLGLPFAAWLGARRFLLFFLATTVGAGLLHAAWYWNDWGVAVGASGAVFGVAAGRAWLLALSQRMPPAPRARYLLRQAASWMLINALIWLGGALYTDAQGTAISIAWASHAGGYAAGALLAPLLFPSGPARPGRPAVG